MMSGPHLRTLTPLATEQPRRTPRLTLKPKAPTTGYVHGAWWPRSRDLSTELPPLLAALADRQVRLGGFRTRRPHTADLVGLDGSRLIHGA